MHVVRAGEETRGAVRAPPASLSLPRSASSARLCACLCALLRRSPSRPHAPFSRRALRLRRERLRRCARPPLALQRARRCTRASRRRLGRRLLHGRTTCRRLFLPAAGRDLHACAARLREPDRDRLLRRAHAVLPLADVIDLLADEFSCLGRWCLALTAISRGARRRFSVGHDGSPSVCGRWLDGRAAPGRDIGRHGLQPPCYRAPSAPFLRSSRAITSVPMWRSVTWTGAVRGALPRAARVTDGRDWHAPRSARSAHPIVRQPVSAASPRRRTSSRREGYRTAHPTR